jgi:hypothetical protein
MVAAAGCSGDLVVLVLSLVEASAWWTLALRVQ